MLQNACCLLSDKCLNSERIFNILEYRFQRNSNRTSFYFKIFLPEQPSNNIKLSHSLLKIHPKINESMDNDDENSSSESSEDEIEQISSPNMLTNLTDDNYLDKLVEMEIKKSPSIVESSEDEEEIEDNIQSIDSSTNVEMPSTEVEDLLITFIHYPVKTEPIESENLPQLDGQTDILFNKTKRSTKNENVHSHHMNVAEQKLNNSKNLKTNAEKKFSASIKKAKQSSWSKSKKKLPIVPTGKTLLDYFKVVQHASINDNTQCSSVEKQQNKSSIKKTRIRSSNYFDNCIVIDDDDDDDMQEIKQQCYTNSNNIHTREKLIDHVVHSSEMRIKWLLNVESILLEHISIYHNNIKSSFISIIIINFLKIFIIRNSNHHQDEFSFYQFSITSYLRYLLIDLPTYKHINFNDENTCLDCKQYSLIINILFDLLFDLIEYDICEIYNKEKYRSLLIEDDYFNQLKSMKKNRFDRIKLIIYFIELIGIHRNKCLNKKDEFFLNIEKRIFQSIEDFIRHIIYRMNNLINERLSICLNIMELCLLFVNEKENYIKQMALFLSKLCEEAATYIHLFLFDENLLPDIRLLLINELIGKKFNIKFTSIDNIETFFHHIEISLTPPNPIDDMTLLLIRSLFNTYADVKYSERIISIFRNKLELIYIKLINLCDDSNYFQQIKRTVIFFRLLKCKWNRL